MGASVDFLVSPPSERRTVASTHSAGGHVTDLLHAAVTCRILSRLPCARCPVCTRLWKQLPGGPAAPAMSEICHFRATSPRMARMNRLDQRFLQIHFHMSSWHRSGACAPGLSDGDAETTGFMLPVVGCIRLLRQLFHCLLYGFVS